MVVDDVRMVDPFARVGGGGIADRRATRARDTRAGIKAGSSGYYASRYTG